jgi:hypothetical protein
VELMTLVDGTRVPACIVEKPVAREVIGGRQLVELEASTTVKFAVTPSSAGTSA